MMQLQQPHHSASLQHPQHHLPYHNARSLHPAPFKQRKRHQNSIQPRGSSITTAAAAQAALDQQQVALAISQPPENYEYKADILPETFEVVQQQYPQLMGLVEAGNLVVYRRPSDYQERRTDGYQEPQLIFILGTAHVSQQSADDVSQLIAAVQPDAVVVELCKSRTAVLQVEDDVQQQQRQQQLEGHQQRWQQQWQQWQQRRQPVQDAASSSSSTNSLEEEGPASEALPAAATSSASSNSSSYTNSSTNTLPNNNNNKSNSSSSSSSSSSGGLLGQVRARLAAAQSSKASNPLSLSGPDPVRALARSASLGGQQAMLLRLLIAGQARKAADQLGVQPGAEFRAAAEASAAVPGGQCCLVLGDRPIEITLSRAWEALSWRRRLQLLADLAAAGMMSSKQAALNAEAVESLRSDDAISGLFNALSTQYPELVAPLVTERDLYLSWSLKRSKAVNGTRAVVGCVGKGHLRGIVYALKHDQGNLRFKDLVGGKNNRQNRQAAAAAAAKRLALEVVLGAAAYAAWVAATGSSTVGQ